MIHGVALLPNALVCYATSSLLLLSNCSSFSLSIGQFLWQRSPKVLHRKSPIQEDPERFQNSKIIQYFLWQRSPKFCQRRSPIQKDPERFHNPKIFQYLKTSWRKTGKMMNPPENRRKYLKMILMIPIKAMFLRSLMSLGKNLKVPNWVCMRTWNGSTAITSMKVIHTF